MASQDFFAEWRRRLADPAESLELRIQLAKFGVKLLEEKAHHLGPPTTGLAEAVRKQREGGEG